MRVVGTINILLVQIAGCDILRVPGDPRLSPQVLSVFGGEEVDTFADDLCAAPFSHGSENAGFTHGIRTPIHVSKHWGMAAATGSTRAAPKLLFSGTSSLARKASSRY